MKKILSLTSIACSSLFLVSGCGGSSSGEATDNALPAGTGLAITLGAADSMTPDADNPEDRELLLGSAARSVTFIADASMTGNVSIDGEISTTAVYMVHGNIQEGSFDFSLNWHTSLGLRRYINIKGIDLPPGQINGSFDSWECNDGAGTYTFYGTKGTINYIQQ